MILSPTDVQLTAHVMLHDATGKIMFVVIVVLMIDYGLSARHHFMGPKLGSYEKLSSRLTHNVTKRPTVEATRLKNSVSERNRN